MGLRSVHALRSPRLALAASGAAFLLAALLAPLRRPDARWPGGSSEAETLAVGALGLVLLLGALARTPRVGQAVGTAMLALAALALASPLLFGLGEVVRIRLAGVESAALALSGAWVAYAATEGSVRGGAAHEEE